MQLEPINVLDVMRRCQLGGRMFNDQHFTAEPSQIMPDLRQMLEDLDWKRVSELRVAPQLFTGSLFGGLIIRSAIAPVDDGNFLGALVPCCPEAAEPSGGAGGGGYTTGATVKAFLD